MSWRSSVLIHHRKINVLKNIPNLNLSIDIKIQASDAAVWQKFDYLQRINWVFSLKSRRWLPISPISFGSGSPRKVSTMNIYNYISIWFCINVPRKKSEENLAKLVSSNISLAVYAVLQKYAKLYYNNRTLKQPTISHLIRFILNDWANHRKSEEYKKMMSSLDRITDFKRDKS